MKSALFLTFVAVSSYLVVARNLQQIRYDSPELYSIRQQIPKDRIEKFNNFVEFMQKYEKQYDNSEELNRRFLNFIDNLKRLPKSQANEAGTAKHGVTQFFDQTLQEFKQKFTGLKLTHKKRQSAKHDLSGADLAKLENFNLPDSIDWRNKGAVTAIKNQGACGSCFTFGAIGAIEGQWFKKTNKLIAFSEEEVLDCGDDNCGGGDPLHVYDTIAEIGGLQTEQDYPYIAGSGEGINDQCNSNDKKFVAYVNGSRALPIHDEILLAKLLATEGPIEINIDADYLFDYDSGIIKPNDQEPGSHPELINHAVLLVAYGVENNQPFWTIKNSWGTNFGEDGYFRVARNANALYISDTNPSLPLIS
ncbi:hypothetical protein M3Y97_00197900 [Aphelenchoides bicaudatus]|nr:hypothetical protein M3Y97_00197900 [Aphelenchoides bicaudatus]